MAANGSPAKRARTDPDADFRRQVLEGIPAVMPEHPGRDADANHPPKRKDILSSSEKRLAVENALRYVPKEWHKVLAPEFLDELHTYGRIYMYRFRPTYKIYARPIHHYPAKCQQAAAIMLMIENNLDDAVAQHPRELITYGGNGAVFQNWAQYRLVMKYLAEMGEDQTLAMYSGHPLGLFPSNREAPRVIVTNGQMIPNYSKPDDWEKYNALGVTQYGQMTAGSYMYIGPQGIVHGTTITVMNAVRMQHAKRHNGERGGDDIFGGKLFVTAGLGGMSGAQPKAGKIAGVVSVCAEVNPAAAWKRHSQGWVDEVLSDATVLSERVQAAVKKKEALSFAYVGNVVDVWERFAADGVFVDLGSDQTSLHNPWAGGYYPVGLSFEEAKEMMAADPSKFQERVKESLRRHCDAVRRHTDKGTYFFDYGNAFLLECKRAGADIAADTPSGFRYPSYVQDIMGPMFFDFGFGPFRWVCCSGDAADLDATDDIACKTLEELAATAPEEIRGQLVDNINWIKGAKANKLVVGSQARILYADAEGRMKIASAMNKAIAEGRVGPIVLGRDHHDVSGTDSPYRETSNIYDGSSFTADMSVQNCIGDACRGATWVSLHNGGGVGWGEVSNGGFGMLIDGSEDCERRLRSMLHWDTNNGIARRSWARNSGADFAIRRAMDREPRLKVTLAQRVESDILNALAIP